ncbi:MAG: hypothetical protein ACODAJ_07330 [Planctomycetota bacterium]
MFRNADDPDELLILLEWSSARQAREFMASEELRRAMEESGVRDEPDVWFLEEADPPAV